MATVIMSGVGIFKSLPPANCINASGAPSTVTPFDKERAAPRAISSIPSVAINAGIRSFVTRIPLIAPATPPAAMPASIAIGPGTFILTIKWTLTTPLNAITEPTERSIPPPRITIVIPMDAISSQAFCPTMLVMLSMLRKGADWDAKKRNSSIRETAGRRRFASVMSWLPGVAGLPFR